jgi:hypothetical protein
MLGAGTPFVTAGLALPPHAFAGPGAERARVKLAIARRVKLARELRAHHGQRTCRRHTPLQSGSARGRAPRTAPAISSVAHRGEPFVAAARAPPPHLASARQRHRARVDVAVARRVKLIGEIRALPGERAPRRQPLRPGRSAREGRGRQLASGNPARRVGSKQRAGTRSDRRRLRPEMKHVTVLGQRPAMDTGEVRASDRPQPPPAQMALHLVLIGVVADLTQSPKKQRPVRQSTTTSLHLTPPSQRFYAALPHLRTGLPTMCQREACLGRQQRHACCRPRKRPI